MAHGVAGQDIFHDDEDRVRFLGDLRRLVRESGASLLAYCLMGNHFHLAIQVGTVTLSSIMHRLLTGHAKAMNRRGDRTGHLFWSRHEAILCCDEKYLAGLIRYIHLNPVRAGLVTKAEDWPWSSLEGKPLPEDAAGNIDQFDPWPRVDAAQPTLIRPIRIDVPDIDEIGKDVSVRTGIQISEIRSGACRRPVVAAKRLLTREAVRYGHPLIDIARWLNSSPTTLTRYARSESENTGKPGTILAPSKGRR